MSLSFLARTIVIGVLALAGAAKIRRGGRSVAAAAEALGIRPPLATLAGRWLAPTELAVAALLCFGETVVVGSLAATILFGAFAVLVASNVARGRRPSCACFGEASVSAISGWTLARNLLFTALAGLVLAGGGRESLVAEAARAVTDLGVPVAIAWIAIAQFATLLLLLRSPAPRDAPTAPAPPEADRETAAAPSGWPAGTLAPAFDLPSLSGDRVTLHDLVARGRDIVLVFGAPECASCAALLPEVARFQEAHREALTIAFVSRGSALANRDHDASADIRDFLLQGGSEVAEAYRATWNPSAVVVDRSRRIASRVAQGPVEIRQLIDGWGRRAGSAAPARVLSPSPPPDAARLAPGDIAPPFQLPSLRGDTVDLAEFAGRLVALVFWDPACGYCREFAPALLERESAGDETAARLVIVSTGAREVVEAERFLSPVLIDPARTVARAYGAEGTPSAILVDAEGRVASTLAVGRAEIDALLRRADFLNRAATRLRA